MVPAPGRAPSAALIVKQTLQHTVTRQVQNECYQNVKETLSNRLVEKTGLWSAYHLKLEFLSFY